MIDMAGDIEATETEIGPRLARKSEVWIAPADAAAIFDPNPTVSHIRVLW
jgi:hypothetical protein